MVNRIHIDVPRVDYEKLNGDRMGVTNKSISKRVQVACNLQLTRFANIVANAGMRVGEIRQYCQSQDEGQNLMRAATSCCA